jgi:DNA ligase (NAD+)
MTKEQYAQSVADLNTHCHRYHNLGKPIISDAEYDALYRNLLEFEKANPALIHPESPTQRVGSPVESFKKYTRKVPMLSLNNVYSEDELIKWATKIVDKHPDATFLVEPKFDGVACELIYKDGVLVTGATRGDGITGEDITSNVKAISNIPLRFLNPKFCEGTTEVRGEVVIPKEVFKITNFRREKSGKRKFANARNAASGTLKSLDPAACKDRGLYFIPYTLMSDNSSVTLSRQLSTHRDILTELGFLGRVPLSAWGVTCDTLFSFVSAILKARDTYPFDIDGAVVKVDESPYHVLIGYTNHAPKWAVAYKFPAQQVTSTITDIICQVGRTGAITPVATIAPVFVGGVTVSNVTLHNADFVKDKDIRIGDTVFVERAGDVIPAITSVVLEKRPENATPWEMPETCPICASPLTKDKVKVYCHNPNCWGTISTKLRHFVSKEAFNIQHCGQKVINALLNNRLIETPADLFKLTEAQVSNLPGFGDKSAKRLIDSIADAKEITLENFLYSFGIPQIGRTVSKLLVKEYETLERITDLTMEELTALRDIGEVTAFAIVNAIPGIKQQYTALTDAGVKVIENTPQQQRTDSTVAGKTFVITGSFDQPRSFYKSKLENAGAKVTGSVSKRTDFLLCGENPGSKLEKAKNLDIHIVSQSDFSIF